MIPVILSGGGGTRLWPVSRPSMPKQFAELLDESLFIKTAKRLVPFGSPWVVTVRQMEHLTQSSLEELGLQQDQVLYEPFARNTAPAIAFLCRRFEMLGKVDEIVGIFPADHLIEEEEKFRAAVNEGEQFARQGNVVTLGVKPTYAATGYGYIATQGGWFGSSRAVLATGFREKPTVDIASEFLAQGSFYWNAGMFIFRVADMIELFRKYAGEMWQIFAELKHDLSNLATTYKRVESISVDYAIMERLPSHVCIPCTFPWNDLGTWDSMAALPTRLNNSKVVQIKSGNNSIFPVPNKKYGLIGLEDFIVVDTEDALLIAKKGSSESVKQVVEAFSASEGEN